jgi:mannosyltransferase
MSHRFFWTDALPLADLPDHYTAFDVVYAPPRSEGFGLTPLEAMACEVPALATPVGPFDLQIEDGQTGRILPVGDAAGFSDALNDLLANPERRVAWGKAGRKRVEAQFDINRKAREIVDFNVIC